MATGEHVIDVTSDQFEAQVIAQSYERPVVVDFWAPWCAPCRALGPVLEALAQERGGEFVLARLNTDQHPELAQRYAIRGIPAVKAVVDGKVVDEFVGALPATQVRAWLDKVVPDAADKLVSRSATAAPDDARAMLEEALSLRPRHGGALLALACLTLDDGDPQGARDLLAQVSLEDRRTHAQRVAALELALEGGDLEAARRKVAQAPDDLDARLTLGEALAAHQDWEPALGELLEVIRRSPDPRGPEADRARKAMLRVFEVLGVRSPVSDQWRSRLAMELYR